MAADEDAQDAVRRILKDRPPEKLPDGADVRLKQRLDREARAKPAAVPRATRTPAARKTSTPGRKTPKR